MALSDDDNKATIDILTGVLSSPSLASFVKPLNTIVKRPSFASAMNDLLSTPGYSSEEARRWGSHDNYMENVFGKTPATQPGDTTNVDEPDEIEALNAKAKDAELEAVQAYEGVFADHLETFSLPEPMSLVVRNGSEYKRKPFIGGEDFTPARGYIGKRGETIITFKPVGPADFEEMEMTEKQARSHFTGFGMYLTSCLGEVGTKLQEARDAATRAQELENMKAKQDTYADQGFGSW